MSTIDPTKVKNLAVKDLVLRSAEIAKANTYGYNQPKYSLQELIINFSMVQAIEDSSDNATRECIALSLDKRIDKILLGHYTSMAIGGGGEIISPPSTGSSSGTTYQGSIASESEMINVFQASNTEGWWWNITADFAFMGVTYLTGTEVWWINNDFEKQGNTDEYSRMILAVGNTTSTADGNWRMIEDSGKFLIQKKISGNWVTRNSIS